MVLAAKKEQGGGGEWRETVYGRFSSDFVEDCLVNLCDQINGVQTGPFGSQLHKKDYVSSGTPIITVEHLGDNRILHEDMPYVSDHDRERLSKYSLHNGDIVFSRVGSVDRRALVRKAENGWLFSGRCLRVRPDPNKIDSAYLSYFFGLPSFKEHVRAIAVGATMPSLNTQILSDIVVPHPCDLTEQRAVAHILGTLDDKIELNRRMNETLEAMARALFKSWFVDFEPVRAKAALKCHAGGENDWTLERARGYLDNMGEVIAALFPDSFVESELGEIPEGWGVKTIKDIVEVSSGKRPGVRYAEALDLAQVPLWGGNGPMAFVPEPLVEYPILLTGRVGTLGSVFRITSPCWPSDNTLILKIKDKRAFEFVFFQLKRIDFTSLNVGSTQPLLTQTNLKAQLLLFPPENILERFHAFAEISYAGLDKSDSESRTLAALRDTLLPKLISGGLRVVDAQRDGVDA